MRFRNSMRDAHTHTIAGLLAAAALLVASAASAADAPPPKPTKVTGDFSYVSTAGNSEVQTPTGTRRNWSTRPVTGSSRRTRPQYGGTESGVEPRDGTCSGSAATARSRNACPRTGWGCGGATPLLGSLASSTRARDWCITRSFRARSSWISRRAPASRSGAIRSAPRTTSVPGGSRRSIATTSKEKTYFEGGGNYLGNLTTSNDYEWDATTSLVAPLSGILALTLGYNYHYRNAPLPGIKTWDSTFAAGIQVSY